jgi:hypothetical protein
LDACSHFARPEDWTTVQAIKQTFSIPKINLILRLFSLDSRSAIGSFNAFRLDQIPDRQELKGFMAVVMAQIRNLESNPFMDHRE